MKEVKLANGVEIRKSIFDKTEDKPLALGGRLDFEVPKDCDLIILMGNKGGGYVPYSCLLPHQVYMDDIKNTFEEKGFEVIYVVPIKSSDPFHIAFNGDYGKQRWENK